MSDLAELHGLLAAVTETAGKNFFAQRDRFAKGERNDQYAFDLAVDGPLVESLVDAGLGILSEEAGELHLDRDLVAVVDPIDGSTNASRGLPWFATSICVVDAEGPLASIVTNHASGDSWTASRGDGAFLNGERLVRPTCQVGREIVGLNGIAPARGPWWQARTFGAAALDLCAVASGQLDGYVDLDDSAHGVWDFLGALLVCREVGVEVIDVFDRPMTVLEHDVRRAPVAATSRALAAALKEYGQTLG